MGNGAKRTDLSAAESRWFIGEDQTFEVDVDKSDGSTAEVMSGWALEAVFKDSIDGLNTAAWLTLTTGSGITIGAGDGPSSLAILTVADTDTEGQTPGRKFILLRRTDAGNEKLLAIISIPLQSQGIV